MLFLLACAGSVTLDVDGMEPFGPVLGAVWIENSSTVFWQIDSATGDISRFDVQITPLNIRSYVSSCAIEQADLAHETRRAQALTSTLGSEGGNVSEICDAMTEWAEGGGSDVSGVRRTLSLDASELFDGPRAGTFDAQGVLLVRESCSHAEEAWDPASCSFQAGGDFSGEAEVEGVEGELDLSVDTLSVHGTFVGESDSGGSVEASFSAERCDVPEAEVIAVF